MIDLVPQGSDEVAGNVERSHPAAPVLLLITAAICSPMVIASLVWPAWA
jgi:hypothetical protein